MPVSDANQLLTIIDQASFAMDDVLLYLDNCVLMPKKHMKLILVLSLLIMSIPISIGPGFRGNGPGKEVTAHVEL